MRQNYLGQVVILTVAAATVGCLSHPATRAGDAHFEAAQYARAAAAYRHGLEQGIDSESERERVKKQLDLIEQSMVDEYVERRLREARDGDVEAALRISEQDGWGRQEARTESDAILLEHLDRALTGAEQSSTLSAAQITRIASIERIADDARAMGRSALEASMQGVSAQRGIEAVKQLGRLSEHPGWHIPKLADQLQPKFIQTGDTLLSQLDESTDFEAFELVRKERGFGHRPWDERAAAVMASRLRAAMKQADGQALAGDVLAARQTLMNVAAELPLTSEQENQLVAEWRRIAGRRGQELLRAARENSNSPATAYVYAALAQYFGASGAESAKAGFGRRFLGRPLSLKSVRIEPVVQHRGDCKIQFEPEATVVGAAKGTQEQARITVNLYCGTILDVKATRGAAKTESSSEYVTTETTETISEYCRRLGGTSAEVGRCTMFMKSRSTVENEETLTTRDTERVVTDTRTTISVQLTGNVEVENRWGIQLDYNGKRVAAGDSERTTKIPVNMTRTTRESLNTQTRRVEYSPPQVFFGLPSGSSALWDPRTQQLTTKVGTETYATPSELFSDYSSAVEQVRNAVESENGRKRSEALRTANQDLERARQSDDRDAVMAALLRISMLRSDNTVQAAAFGELNKQEQELFKLTAEPLSAIEAGIAGGVATLGDIESIALAKSTWQEPGPGKTERTEEITRTEIVKKSMRDVEHDVRPWRSTGLNQHIDLGPIAAEEGSSVVELSTYAQGIPLADAEIASVVAGRLTIGGTSLETGFALRPFELTRVEGFEVALRHSIRFEGSSSDPKPVPYFGLAYRQLRRESDPNTPTASQDSGFRFLGAEAGVAVPFGQWLSLDVGTEWNALWAVDLFDDANEFTAMSPMHGGLTVYLSSLYLHARGIYWLNSPADLSPVGWRVQAGARF